MFLYTPFYGLIVFGDRKSPEVMNRTAQVATLAVAHFAGVAEPEAKARIDAMMARMESVPQPSISDDVELGPTVMSSAQIAQFAWGNIYVNITTPDYSGLFVIGLSRRTCR